MLNILLSLFGKSTSAFSNQLNLGAGSTWPGHVALNINKDFIKQTIGNTKVILVAGTNGKTTTSSLIYEIFKQNNKKVLQNRSGANLLNGAASTIIQALPLFSSKLKSDYLILEVDENNLALMIEQTNPDYIICLNLFRDQLDRYGEIDSIIKKWKDSFNKLDIKTTLILNADDPQVANLGEKLKNKVLYFGLNENNQKELEHGADSMYCPNCLTNLEYKSIVFSHLGNWSCPKCGLKRPNLDISEFEFYPLPGSYNKYNTLASILATKAEGLNDNQIIDALKSFKPAFGRQEEFEVDGKKVKIFLSKNPTSFNQSLSAISDLNAQNLLVVLNDRIPDGLDVSWIWDTNTSPLNGIENITASGDRTFDIGLRLKYAGLKNFQTEENLNEAIKKSLGQTKADETLYVLPTYSAMLEVRKILGGRKIL